MLTRCSSKSQQLAGCPSRSRRATSQPENQEPEDYDLPALFYVESPISRLSEWKDSETLDPAALQIDTKSINAPSELDIGIITSEHTQLSPKLPIPDGLSENWCDIKDLNLPNCDTNYHEVLEKQGCFQVPSASALAQFFKCYFLHVHPMLPIIREDRFWAGGSPDAAPDISTAPPLELPLFQAILFAASSVSWIY